MLRQAEGFKMKYFEQFLHNLALKREFYTDRLLAKKLHLNSFIIQKLKICNSIDTPVQNL